MDFVTFLQWERASRDIIDFKKIYCDVCGDTLGGLMLSEIVYWHLPTQRGETKLRVEHGGFEWIAVRRYEWWDRIRLSPREADRALRALVDTHLVIKEVFKFYGEPTTHVRLNQSVFLPAIEKLIATPPTNPYLPSVKTKSPNGENGNHQTVKTESPNGENGITDSGSPVTETPSSSTTPTTTESTARPRFRVWVQFGERYADGALIDVAAPNFEDVANAIFWAWLEVLQEFHAKPDTEPVDLWEKQRAAIVGLVKHRRTPEQVAAYVRSAYSDPKDSFWRSPIKLLNLVIVANNLGAWLSKSPSTPPSEPPRQKARGLELPEE